MFNILILRALAGYCVGVYLALMLFVSLKLAKAKNNIVVILAAPILLITKKGRKTLERIYK